MNFAHERWKHVIFPIHVHIAAPVVPQSDEDQQMAAVDRTTQNKAKLSKTALKKLKAKRKMKRLGIKKGQFYF